MIEQIVKDQEAEKIVQMCVFKLGDRNAKVLGVLEDDTEAGMAASLKPAFDSVMKVILQKGPDLAARDVKDSTHVMFDDKHPEDLKEIWEAEWDKKVKEKWEQLGVKWASEESTAKSFAEMEGKSHKAVKEEEAGIMLQESTGGEEEKGKKRKRDDSEKGKDNDEDSKEKKQKVWFQ